jgi:hypothetical protein
MHYRNITVGEKTYQYNIGKKFVKIKDHSTVPIEKIGNRVDDITCEFMVTPHDIKRYIQTGKKQDLKCVVCGTKNKVDLHPNPYYEHHVGKTRYAAYCDGCYGDDDHAD